MRLLTMRVWLDEGLTWPHMRHPHPEERPIGRVSKDGHDVE